ncbi:MAG TPA: HAD family phosphatase [Candidatus Saccharimonadales bacterium]|nr:HAD family phosphatase [Candidatus Saccharimonadales bacterium]
MNKAFIFDMDGVIINSESVWGKHGRNFLTNLLGKDIYEKVKDHLLGSTTNVIYDQVVQNGGTISKEVFLEKYDEQAMRIYALSTPTNDINKLLQKLDNLNFKIGLVTSSRPLWMEIVLKKIKNRNLFEYTLSLAERSDLRSKPYPDGFLEAIKMLGSTPEKTIILEDSNRGIASAKASGAFTICLREHLEKEYQSEGADMYVENLRTLLTFLDEINYKYE